MTVLCVHHKGGVGKTTAAIHVAGVLIGTGKPVLLIDADTQADSYRFFNRGLPPEAPEPHVVDGLGLVVEPVMGRRLRDALPAILRATDAEHIVIDAQPDLAQIATLLSQSAPDLVLLCVKRDDLLSFSHLGSMFEALGQLRETVGMTPRVSIVSAGADSADFKGYIPETSVPYDIPDPLPFEPLLVGKALLSQQFVWDLEGGGPFAEAFSRLVDPIIPS